MSHDDDDRIIFVIDDDAPALKSLCFMIEKLGYPVKGFSSPKDFLEQYDPLQGGVLICDLRMPEMTGLELQQELLERNSPLPMIIVTGYGNIASCTKAFKAGAVDFLEKPVDSKALVGLIKVALEKETLARRKQDAKETVEYRVGRLTPREKEVMELLVSGKSMKEIATDFGTSFQTIAKHRMKVLEKLGVENDIALVHLMLSARN